MGHSKVTLIGLETFLNPDHSVFEAAEFPEGINKETLMGAIFLRCQEFELLYSDPDFMIAAVNIWARKHYWTFDKWVKLLSKEYDPLYNKDYYEVIQDTHEGASSGSGNNSQTDSYTNSNTTKHSEKAYNTGSGYNEIEKDESSGSNGGTTSGSFSSSGNDSYVNGHNYHGYGNIGITSAQELFLKEADVARFNLYEQIADLFCNEFCIMVF